MIENIMQRKRRYLLTPKKELAERCLLIEQELNKLHSIIKEARELLNQDWYVVLRKGTITRVKQILDGDSNVS